MYLPPDHYIPQCVSDRLPLMLWAAMAAGAVLFIGMIVGAPLARANSIELLSLPLYQAFSNVCHQDPARSFFLAGHPLAVCARCTGLYLGFAAAVVFYPLMSSLRRTHTPEKKWLFIAATPLAIDFALGLFGIWENTHSSRFFTAALLGIVTAFYIMPALVELVRFPRPSNSLRNTQAGRNAGFSASSEAQPLDAASGSIPSVPISAPSDYSSPHRRI